MPGLALSVAGGVPLSDDSAHRPLHVLFVCSKNQWRSPTAEQLYRDRSGLRVRSAGTSKRAHRPVRRVDLQWADLVLAMEHKHIDRLRAAFRDELQGCEVRVLGIPDRHHFMDPELVREILAAVDPILAGRIPAASENSTPGNDTPERTT